MLVGGFWTILFYHTWWGVIHFCHNKNAVFMRLLAFRKRLNDIQIQWGDCFAWEIVWFLWQQSVFSITQHRASGGGQSDYHKEHDILYFLFRIALSLFICCACTEAGDKYCLYPACVCTSHSLSHAEIFLWAYKKQLYKGKGVCAVFLRHAHFGIFFCRNY